MQKVESAIAEEEQSAEVIEKIEAIDVEIKKQLQMSEKLGDEGRIEEAEAAMHVVEALRKRKEEIKLAGDLNTANRFMKVCEVCGGLQAVNDTEKRALAHLEGRLHTGYAILRKEVENLRKRREELDHLAVLHKRDSQKEKEVAKPVAEERPRETSNQKGKDRKKSRSRSGSKDSRDRRRRRDDRGKSRKSYSRSSSSEGKKKSHKRDRSRDRKDKKRSSRERKDDYRDKKDGDRDKEHNRDSDRRRDRY